MMAHKFDVGNQSKLESEEYKRLFMPYLTLEKLGYEKGDVIADIGCGISLFTMHAVKQGCEHAKIYEVDASDEMLDEVEKQARVAGFKNIILVKSEEYDFKLGDEAVGFVLIYAVLHKIDDKIRFMKEAARICRKGGKIVVIEFNESYTDYGPPLDRRITRQQVYTQLVEAGFRYAIGTDISRILYVAVAWKA